MKKKTNFSSESKPAECVLTDQFLNTRGKKNKLFPPPKYKPVISSGLRLNDRRRGF